MYGSVRKQILIKKRLSPSVMVVWTIFEFLITIWLFNIAMENHHFK